MLDLDLMKKLGAKFYGNINVDNIPSIISYDKQVIEGSMFVVLPGGDPFVNSAIKNGAGLLLSDHYLEGIEIPQIVVINLQKFIISYAKEKLKEFQRQGKKFFAVMGSVSKTTIKHFLRSLLPGKVFSTSRSFNTGFSIAMEMLLLNNDFDYIVTEIGIDYPGDYEREYSWMNPDYIIYTPIGIEHLSKLGSEEVVWLTQMEFMNSTNLAFIHNNVPEKYFNLYKDKLNIYDFKIEYKTKENNKKEVILTINQNEEKIIIFESNLKEYSINGICTVLYVLTYLGISYKDTMHLLSPICLRGNQIITENHKIFDHCYNASPLSVINTINSIEEECDFILGEIGELGEQSNFFHRQIIDLLDDNKFVRYVYLFNCNYSGKKIQSFNLQNLHKNIYIQGSKSNHLIAILLQIIAQDEEVNKKIYRSFAINVKHL